MPRCKLRFSIPLFAGAPDNGSRPKGGLFERSAEKSGGVRRTCRYAATTRDEGNDADGRFFATC
jgi:hypothetical protein